MSATVLLSQLKALVEKTEQLKGKCYKVHPTNDQWITLGTLSLQLLGAASKLREEIDTLKQSRTQRALKESATHRSHAQSSRGDLFAKGRLRQPAAFRRNIVRIFEGPKPSTFDSEDTKFRKESTRKRCEVIRGLNPDGVVSWAIAYAPTLWAGGSMALDVFDCLIDSIEPELVQTWPPVIQDTLHKLQEDEPSLQKSPEYSKFLKAIDDPSSREEGSERNRKRKRTENERAAVEQLDRSRQIQHLERSDEMHDWQMDADGQPQGATDQQLLKRRVEATSCEADTLSVEVQGKPQDGTAALLDSGRTQETLSSASVQLRSALPEQVLDLKFTELMGFLCQCENSYPNIRTVHRQGKIPLPAVDVIVEPALGLTAKIEFSLRSLNFTELLGFLQQLENNCPDLCLVCPWGGVPLPYIKVTTSGLSAEIECSLRLSEALMQYMFSLRTAGSTEISH